MRREAPKPAAGAAPRPQPSAPRALPKPVRPPSEMLAAAAQKAAAAPGASEYDDSDSPTQYQPMPEGFSEKTFPPQQVGTPSEPPTRIVDTHAEQESPLSEEKTRVIEPPDDPTATAERAPAAAPSPDFPKKTVLGMGPPPMPRDLGPAVPRVPVAAPPVEPQIVEASRQERPKPPSAPPSGENATVVKPLEQFLADAGRPESPDTAKQPLQVPTPAAGRPPPTGQAFGATLPLNDGRPPWAPDASALAPERGFSQQPGATPYDGSALAPAWQQPGGGYPTGGGFDPPGQPAQPGVGLPPGMPPMPGMPMQGGMPGMPMQTGMPGQPGMPMQGGMPGMPMQTGMPGQPGMPMQTGMPGQPGMPMQTGMPGQPGMPMQTGMPGQPGMPMQTGMPGMPMQPGMPGAVGMSGQYPPAGYGYPGQQQWVQTQAPQGAKAGGPLAAWKAMPFPRKLMFIMLPFGLIAFIIVFTDPPAPSPQPNRKASAGASASAAPSAGVPAGTTSAAPPETTSPPPEPSPTPSTSAPPVPAPKTAETAAPPAPSASAEPPLAKGELTLERKAADAVAANDFVKAAEFYDQLAKQHPDNAAYARAAEILRKKAKK
ncbi:MAG: hypothetical protein U0263_27510 [Polyangiaceae bacterium]